MVNVQLSLKRDQITAALKAKIEMSRCFLQVLSHRKPTAEVKLLYTRNMSSADL